MASTTADADAVLSLYIGKLPYRVRPNFTNGQRMVNDANVLDSYNNGVMTPGCTPWSAGCSGDLRPNTLPLSELALVLVRFDHDASVIIKPNNTLLPCNFAALIQCVLGGGIADP